jgi:hypothetical protein
MSEQRGSDVVTISREDAEKLRDALRRNADTAKSVANSVENIYRTVNHEWSRMGTPTADIFTEAV